MPAPADQLPSGAALELELPAVVSSVDRVQDLVARLHETTVDDLTFTDRMRFESALVEIVANVVEHSRPVGGDEVRMVVQLCRQDRDLTAVVLDDGEPAVVDVGSAGMSAVDSENGRGLAMARALASELRYERDGDRNRWTVRCTCTT